MKLKHCALMACAGLACAPAFLAAAGRPTGGQDQAAYLACYGEVLAQPQFESLDPAELYAIARSVADQVVAKCEKYVRALREELLAGFLRAQEQGVRKGGTRLPDTMLVEIAEATLRIQVADDLAEADPRVKPIADANRP